MENNKTKIKIIFMGTPEFGANILEDLIKSNYAPVLAITETDKPVGRKQIVCSSPVKITAQKYGIPVEQPKLISNFKIPVSSPDLIIVAAYGQILPKEILAIPKYGCLNVHPSLLPKHRGPSPIQSAILNGDEETGVTIIKISEKVDSGPIVAIEKLKTEIGNMAYKDLHDELARLGGKILIKVLSGWVEGKIKAEPQDKSKATYTKIIKKEDGKIDWQKPANILEREIRAFYPWPGSYAIWETEEKKQLRIKILKARILKYPYKTDYPAGKVLVVPQNEIGVQCGKDFLVVEKLQIEGKKELIAEDFLRGYSKFIGIIFK